MKSKILFFIVILFLVGIKWGYDFMNSANAVEVKALNFENDNSKFDSVNEWMAFKNSMLQNNDDNKVRVNNIKSAIFLEDILIRDKFEKQIECIEFKNNQLELCLNDYKLESVRQFQFFKINLNRQLEENNQLINDLVKKHESFSKHK